MRRPAIRTAQRGNGDFMFLQSNASGESARVSRRTLRILIVDDSYDTVDTLTVILRDEGHEVWGVHDGPSVVPLTRKLRPDAVILDIGMPTMSGYDLAVTAHGSPPRQRAP